MLQSLLQPRDHQRPKMIGAMPAVAVRHERRRAEKRTGGRRPSQLPLQVGRALEDSTPSPDHRIGNGVFVCGRLAVLHAIVGCLLLGIVVLVVGLVQLSPGAEAAQHRFYFLGAGGILLGAGLLGACLRWLCYYCNRHTFEEENYSTPIRSAPKNCVSLVESGHGLKDGGKPHLKTQSSVAHDTELIKQLSIPSE